MPWSFIRQRPVPVGRAEDAFDVVAGALCHQAGEERYNDLEVLTVDLFVTQTELGRLGKGVDHILTVVVKD